MALHGELFEVRDGGDDRWAVYLPHQCDDWEIAGARFDPVPHTQAVAELESFVAQAQAALAALKERRAQASDEDWWRP